MVCVPEHGARAYSSFGTHHGIHGHPCLRAWGSRSKFYESCRTRGSDDACVGHGFVFYSSSRSRVFILLTFGSFYRLVRGAVSSGYISYPNLDKFRQQSVTNGTNRTRKTSATLGRPSSRPLATLEPLTTTALEPLTTATLEPLTTATLEPPTTTALELLTTTALEPLTTTTLEPLTAIALEITQPSEELYLLPVADKLEEEMENTEEEVLGDEALISVSDSPPPVSADATLAGSTPDRPSSGPWATLEPLTTAALEITRPSELDLLPAGDKLEEETENTEEEVFGDKTLISVSSSPPVSADATLAESTPDSPSSRPLFDSSTPVDLGAPACRRLIGQAFSPHEVISLIEAIFTGKDEIRMIRNLRGDAAQTFIDAVHEVRLHIPSFSRHSLTTFLFVYRSGFISPRSPTTAPKEVFERFV